MKPLEGIRVVDFGIITAGASTSAILADLGAEVIKIEGPHYIDPFRNWTGISDNKEWWNSSPHFHFTNRNKKNVCIDLKSKRGRAILLELVSISDIVIENFRVGVLEKLGLGFQELEKANPRIVLGSVSSQGLTGPESGSVSFGSTLEASSGFADLIRYDRNEAPHISGQALNYPDQVVSLFAAGLIVSTVLEARDTDRAYHVDISQREVTAFLLGEKLVAAAHGLEPDASTGAPDLLNGVYACADNQWIAITLRGTEAPTRMQASGLDAGNRESLDAQLKSWCETRTAQKAIEQLQNLDITASLACRVSDLQATGCAEDDSTAFARAPDGQLVKGLPWRIDGKRMTVHHSAPKLGEHNRDVVVGILNHSDEFYAELVKLRVLAQAPAHVHVDPSPTTA